MEKDRKDTSFTRMKKSPCCWLWPSPAARAAVAAYYDARGNEVDRDRGRVVVRCRLEAVVYAAQSWRWPKVAFVLAENAGERNTTSILKTKAETATDRWCDGHWMGERRPGLRKRLRVGNAACVGSWNMKRAFVRAPLFSFFIFSFLFLFFSSFHFFKNRPALLS